MTPSRDRSGRSGRRRGSQKLGTMTVDAGAFAAGVAEDCAKAAGPNAPASPRTMATRSPALGCGQRQAGKARLKWLFRIVIIHVSCAAAGRRRTSFLPIDPEIRQVNYTTHG